MGVGTLLVAFGRKWVRGKEALLLWGEFGRCVPRLRFKCMELRPSRRTGWGLLTGKEHSPHPYPPPPAFPVSGGTPGGAKHRTRPPPFHLWRRVAG